MNITQSIMIWLTRVRYNYWNAQAKYYSEEADEMHHEAAKAGIKADEARDELTELKCL